MLYVDRETWRILSSDLYDAIGEPSKNLIQSFAPPEASTGDVRVPSVTMVDVKAARTTYCALPGGKGDPSSWRVNTGTSDATNQDGYSFSMLIVPGR